jgi:hypothetical protein
MSTRTVTTGLLTTAALVLASLTACGDDSNDSIALADWVAEFDRICVEVAEKSSGGAISEAEFRKITEDALAEMRELGEPAEQADDAAAMLESIEKTTFDDTLTDAEINQLDQQFLDAAEAVGVSDACITGPQG